MIRNLLFCIFSLSILSEFSLGSEDVETFDWANFSTQRDQAKYISDQFKRWNNKNPNLGEKSLRVIYFHAKDRKPLKNHVERWNGILTDIQNFFRTEMSRLGYNQVTLSLEKDNGILKLHEIQGTQNEGNYSYKSGGEIREEVFKALRLKGINPEEETLLIVCGLSKTIGKKVTIYSPYYGMGANHNKGICFTADMEWLSIDGLRPDPKKIVLQVKEHRNYEPFTLNRFNTVYIGGTIHELGHGLSLPHNLATKIESIHGTALMGAGNYTYRREWNSKQKGSFLTHSSAIRLLVHPLFRGTTRQAKSSPSLKYKDLGLSFKNGIIQIDGKIETDIPAIAMIAYNDRENEGQRGYMVNNNYDATSWTSVLSPTNEFRLEVSDLRNGNHQIRLLSVHMNGATETKRIHYSMKDGMPDLKRADIEIISILSNND